MFWTPYSAVADAFMDQAAQGQSYGTQFMQSYTIPHVDSTTGTMTLTNGAVAGQTLQQNELFQQIQPGSMDGIAASYGDNTAMGNNVNTGVSALTTGVSVHAQAYQTLLGANTSMPDMSNDPIWTTSDHVFTQQSSQINDLFTGCSKTTSLSQTSCSVHVPDYQTCQKTLAYQSCSVSRNVTYTPLITYGTGGGIIQSCGVGCTDLYVGTVGDNYWGGSCSLYANIATFNVLRPDAITSVTLAMVEFDDYSQINIGGNVVYTGSTGWPGSGSCDLKTNWFNTPNLDITSAFKTGGNITVQQNVRVGGLGEGYLRIRVIGAPDYTDTLIDNPAGCRQRLFDSWPPSNTTAPAWTSNGSLNDQASTPWWQCTNAVTSIDFGTGSVSESVIAPALLPILPDPPASPPAPICLSAQTRMPGTVSLPCFTDVNGYQQCPQVTYDTAAHTSCDSIAANPQCAWVGETCADGAVSPITGTCMQFIETYDCGASAPGQCDQTNTGEQTVCNSQIRCMGGACVNQATESNQDFIKAATALQVLNQAQQSSGCSASTADCALFGGQTMECQMADLSILGTVDCCNMPLSGSWIQYMELAAKTWYLADTSVEEYALVNNGLAATNSTGAWTLVTNDTFLQTPFQTVNQGWTAVTDTFSSMYDSVVSTVSDNILNGIGTGVLDQLEQEAIQQMSAWVMDNFGVQAGEALFSYSTAPTADAAGNMVTEGTATGMSEMLASIINVVGIIYAIYQIAKMVVQLIFACTPDEVKLNMLKEQKLCTYAGEIGSYCSVNSLFGCVARKEAYCCFSSPFARIFQQQARPQLGMNFGVPKNPSCGGLSLNQIATLNFNQMDFSEWINMMKMSGGLPMDGTTANSMYSVGTVTASPMTGVNGQNAQSTLNTQTQGSNIDAIRQAIVNGL